mgnify:CR=1 FL=1
MQEGKIVLGKLFVYEISISIKTELKDYITEHNQPISKIINADVKYSMMLVKE